MTVSNLLQVIDISPYTEPKVPGDRAKVIEQVRNACQRYGFFQVQGHGISLTTQQGVIKSSQELFSLAQEDKNNMSMLDNVVRRGYEQSGDSIRDGDTLPDTKEVSRVVASSADVVFAYPRSTADLYRLEFLHWPRGVGD
jgi:isopenicillin N synthase-like dioxygenase